MFIVFFFLILKFVYIVDVGCIISVFIFFILVEFIVYCSEFIILKVFFFVLIFIVNIVLYLFLNCFVVS